MQKFRILALAPRRGAISRQPLASLAFKLKILGKYPNKENFKVKNNEHKNIG